MLNIYEIYSTISYLAASTPRTDKVSKTLFVLVLAKSIPGMLRIYLIPTPYANSLIPP